MEILTTKQVTMHNQLIRSVHGLNLNEKRLLMLVVSKIDSRTDAVNLLTRVTVAEMLAEYALESKYAYQLTKQAAEGLIHRSVRFIGGYITNAANENVQWVTACGYQDLEAWVEVKLNYDLAPFLTALKEHFTTYKLSNASGLRSVYSWRVYELLIQFKKTGKLTIKTHEFCELLEVPDSISKNFANLRLKVIEPALHEINEKCGLTAEYEPIKTGRKVTGLSFTFTLAIEPPPPIATVSPEPKPLTMKQAKQIRTQQQRLSAIEAQSRAQFEKLAAEYGYNLNDYAHKSNQ